MRLRNVKKQQSIIQERIWQLAIALPASTPAIAELAQAISSIVNRIEAICAEDGSAPAALPTPSRRAYAWLKFLSLDDGLERHLVSTQQAQALAIEILAASDRPEKRIIVHLTDYTGLYKYASDRQSMTAQFSEGFLAADRPTWRAALRSICTPKTRSNLPDLRAFSQTPDYCQVMQTLARLGNDAVAAASGQHYNLNVLFAALNRDYFQGQLAVPQLVWSQRATRRKLGYYERSRDRVVLSRSLDSPQVPDYVVTYVLYHELLHKHCGIHWQNGRQRAHTPEFRAAERRFEHYEAAIAWLQQHSFEPRQAR